jgi:hypothetical protein
MLLRGNIRIRDQMAQIVLTGTHLEVSLNALESRLLGRPNFKIDLGRISAATLGTGEKLTELGTKVSKNSLLGGILGEYRVGSKRVMVLGTSRAGKHVTISGLHPTIDQIIYCEKDAEALYESLTKKR